MIPTFDTFESYVVDDLKVDVTSREVKNKWWWGKHLEIDVSVTAPSLDNYTCLAKHVKLFSPLPYYEAYNTRKNKALLRQKAMDVGISAFNELQKYGKYSDRPKEQRAEDYLNFVEKLEKELIGIVENNEPDGAGPS